MGEVPGKWETPLLKDFCGDNKRVFAIAHEDKEKLEKLAVKLAKGICYVTFL